MDDAIDRWFKFIDEYNKESSVPLSYVLLPNPATTGFRTSGSPIGMTKLNKAEWSKVAKLKRGQSLLLRPYASIRAEERVSTIKRERMFDES